MADNKPQLNEQRSTAASFIINFFNVVSQLKSNYAMYVNIVIGLENKYSNSELMGKMADDEKGEFITQTQNLRYFIIMSYTDYKSLLPYATKEGYIEDKDITETIGDLKSKLTIDRELVGRYVTGINKFLLSNVIKKLLESSQDIINDLYSTG
jgi:hypothetical protein